MITCILMLNVVYGSSFHSFVSRITLQLPCVKFIPCRVTSVVVMQLKQKNWRQARVHSEPIVYAYLIPTHLDKK